MSDDATPRKRPKISELITNSNTDERGLFCPSCECRDLPVYYTRSQSGSRITRVRKCRNCGRKIVTTERVNGS